MQMSAQIRRAHHQHWRQSLPGLRIAVQVLGFASGLVFSAFTLANAAAAPVPLDATPAALAQSMQGHRVVLLGEVHDNAAQHALRVAALRAWLAQGARPVFALEQFDREHQQDIERARRERPLDPDYLIAQAKGTGAWHWEFYRPYIALALEYDLPIVAVNLSRADAMQVATKGWSAIFDSSTREARKLDALPADFRDKHDHAIAVGHCDLLPADQLPTLARAQMARDLVIAQSIGPYLDRGVVLLAGNGHVRRDIGVRFWLPRTAEASAISIGLLERGNDAAAEAPTNFDAYVITERAERPDPCEALAKQFRHDTP